MAMVKQCQKQCSICCNYVPRDEYVELLVEQKEYKIFEKYKWVDCDYCFDCLNVFRKMLWQLYINTLLSTECKNELIYIMKIPLPMWITSNLQLEGMIIKSIYYKGNMYSSRLQTGLSEFQLNNFQIKIKQLYAMLLQSDTSNQTNILNLQGLIANLIIQ